MTIYINPDEQNLLDPAIDDMLNVLRQLELDETDIHEHIDERVIYIFSKLLNTIYTHNASDLTLALGVVEQTKLQFFIDQLLPRQDQAEYDRTINSVD